MGLGTLTAFLYAVTLFYCINDLNGVVTAQGSYVGLCSRNLRGRRADVSRQPVAIAYRQAVGSAGGTLGLLIIVLLIGLLCVLATILAVSATLVNGPGPPLTWTVVRPHVVGSGQRQCHALPAPVLLGLRATQLPRPRHHLLLCAPQPLSSCSGGSSEGSPGVIAIAISAIQLGSKTAFSDIVGSFVILTTVSYAIAILPHLLSGRRNVPRGPFWMGSAGFVVNGLAVAFIVLFDTMFCFPYTNPTTVE